MKVSVVIPTFNEEESIQYAFDRVSAVMNPLLVKYDYEIIFIDNCSTDRTRNLIETMCENHEKVKAIFNSRNFGFSRSTFYGITQAKGDCVILLFCDMQDPPELIPKFLEEWENGYKIVAGIKNKSKEFSIKYLFRKLFYKFIKTISDIEHISQFTGFGLYDASFVNTLRALDDSLPYLRGIVAELGPKRKDVYYQQEKRRHGKSNFNFLKLYDVAMLGITSYSKTLARVATMLGVLLSIVCMIIVVVTVIMHVANIRDFQIGMAAVMVGVFTIGSVQLLFLGLIGEYILNINQRVMRRPLVVEERRINFESENGEGNL